MTRYKTKYCWLFNLLWSAGTGHSTGTWWQHAVWQVNPHTSHTIPCRIRPTISEVQWLHLVGDENVRTRNWCDLCFTDIGDGGSCYIHTYIDLCLFQIEIQYKLSEWLTILISDRLLFELAIDNALLSSISPSSLSIEPPWYNMACTDAVCWSNCCEECCDCCCCCWFEFVSFKNWSR